MKIKILMSHLNVSGTDYKYRPSWFSFENCFVNLIKTTEKHNNVDLHVIYDVSRGDVYQNWINKYKEDYTLHKIQGGSMDKAAMEMYKIAMHLSEGMDDNDLFYFLENDYLHVYGWVGKLMTLYKTFNGLNYVSLYDHGDKYMEMYNDLTSKIVTTKNHHWRTTPSTCGSYICSKKMFLEDYNEHTNVVGDHNKWLYLNETKGRFILTPMPGFSTHCMEGLMSPTIDWRQINENTKYEIELDKYPY